MKKRFISILTIFIFIITSISIHSQTLKIYTEIAPPDQFIDKNGKLNGFGVEVVNEIQKRLGINFPIEATSWSWAYNKSQKEDNIILFSVTKTFERTPLFQWVGPINEDKFGFYATKDSKLKIEGLEDAKKVKSIGVYANDVRAQFLLEKEFKNLDQAYDQIANYKKLYTGRIDMMAGSLSSFSEEAKLAGFNGDDFKLLYVFMKAELYITFSKKMSHETVELWKKALEGMKKDGTFKAIFRKYYPNGDLPE